MTIVLVILTLLILQALVTLGDSPRTDP